MKEVKQIEIKNRTYYFYNDIINIEEFNLSLLKQTKNRTKILISVILDTSQLKKTDDYKNIYSVNPLHLMIGEVDGHIECNSVELQLHRA